MRAWSVLRQLLAATLCALLVTPAYPSASTLPRSSSTPSHSYDAETLSKTRVWGSNEKILLHFRAVLLLSEKQHWGCEERSEKVAVGSGVTYDYDAFGNLIHSTGTTPNNYLFAGEQYDPDLGLYYNRARYLNVSTGRFWSMDDDEGNGYEPVSFHKYLYAGANPVGNIDPTGHDFDLGSVTFAAGEGATIGEEEDAAAISIQQTAFRTTLYSGARAFSQPTILLRAIAALTATAVTAASVFEALSAPGELPDVAASDRDNLFPIVLFRDVDTAKARDFRWRGPEKDPDGLSFFESPFRNPVPKKFSVGFRAKYYGLKRDGTPGGFVEQELLNIPIIYSPSIGGEGHWSVPVTTETAPQYEEKFAEAAQRIRNEDPTRFPRNPNY
jgi:RHS repeat-associated protein